MSHEPLEYRFALELHRRDPPEHLGDVPVAPDSDFFGPALEWASFRTVRSDRARPLVLDGPLSWVEPIWDAKRGEPYVGGLRAIVAAEGRPALAVHLPLAYFHSMARSASAEFVESGKLTAGEVFEYRVCAFATKVPPYGNGRPEERFTVKPVPQELPVDEYPLQELLAKSEPCGTIDPECMPVFVPGEVLGEVAELMQSAGPVEMGGILLGRLHRDPAGGDLFLEVTAQVRAEHCEQSATRLTFTSDTWAAADAALTLRGQGSELYAGWYHTHPSAHWCEQCDAETRSKCQAAGKTPGDFFSLHDSALHRAVFPRAYSVALVLSDGCRPGDAPKWGLYGWEFGMVQARGFHVLGGVPQPAAAPLEQQEMGHATNA
jgi:proteasome lid subunit RPN8/RPN11